MNLFEYVVILHPTDNAKKEGAQSKIIVPLQQVPAKDEAQVRTIAARAIPEAHAADLDRIEVAVRPF